ncbi:MAG TPA: saccharopine dehydrogenase NADP-binding domain-containing protein [Anaerolineales bacterium]|nr:saccharopine dehydrogenase NADP-binding domain-containing protein [Anaerolineales bacterium]
MTAKTILILGGYGNTGRPLAHLLLQESDAKVVIAGRNREKAECLAGELAEVYGEGRVQAVSVDASNLESMLQAFRGIDIVVVASSTTQYTLQVATAALEAGVDYLDVQYSTQKINTLRSMEMKIRQAGRCFITDGGFHPGLPGLLVRYASQSFDTLESAKVGSVIKEDWKKLQVGDETIAELLALINDFEMLVYKAGKWRKASMLSSSDYLHMDFGKVFGRQYCFPMMLEEMRTLPDLYPTLTDTGFYVGSFNWFVDWVIMPIAILFVKLSPQVAAKPMARWMRWGLNTFSKPPYGTLLRVEAAGKKEAIPVNVAVTISHTDGYLFTAIPVAACLLQYMDGSIKQPGLWWQASVVEPERFMVDMHRMGITVEREGWQKT